MQELNSTKYFRELIHDAEETFNSEHLSTRRYEAERIISHILKISRIDIYTDPNIVISESQNKLICSSFYRRKDGEPLQYILGEENFRKLKLSVGPGVLIPRPETEQIVEKALSLLPSGNAKVLDVGVGSGAIALSIAFEAPSTSVTGVDVSEDALKYSRKNILDNRLSNVQVLRGDLCSGFADSSFDIIIANLPYVTETEFRELEIEVREFEPKLALTSGNDGLDLIRKLVPQSFNILKHLGWLMLEIGYRQGVECAELLKDKHFNNIEIIQDFNQKDRFVIGQKL